MGNDFSKLKALADQILSVPATQVSILPPFKVIPTC